MRSAFLVCAGGLVLAPALAAQDTPALAPGDPAPAFAIAHWVQGEPVAAFEAGKIYVLDFWATWRAPCKDSVPRLSELQAEYAGKLTIIGVTDEKPEAVARFLGATELQGKAVYTLACDPDRSIHGAYLTPAGQTTLPVSFAIGADGKLQWIGHPLNLHKVLPDLVAGTWDAAAARTGFELERQLTLLNRKLAGARPEERQALFEQAASLMEQLAQTNPKVYGQYLVEKFKLTAVALGRLKEAYAQAEPMLKTLWDDADALNEFAWFIVDPEGALPDSDRDLDLAMKAAARACELSRNEDGNILDTLARVHYLKGDLKKAVELQEKAVEHAVGANVEAIRKALEAYRKELAAAQA